MRRARERGVMKDAGEDAAAGACRAAGGDRRTMLGAAVRLTLPIFAAYWLIGLGYGIFAVQLGLLVVYCLRTPLVTGTRLVPALVCTGVTVQLQMGCRQLTLSMAAGTGLYMMLVRLF